MSEQLILLKEIQDIDSRRDGLLLRKKSLPHVKKMNDLKREFTKLKRVYYLKRAQLEDETNKQTKLEGKLEILTEKIDKEDKKLYGGSIKNPKELLDIQNEIKSLKEKKDDFELDLLEIMEKIDGLKSDLENLVGSLKKIKKENGIEMSEYNQIVSEIDEELKMKSKRWNELTSILDKSLFSMYELLRKKNSLAVVGLKDGVCQGCHVKLPAKELDKGLNSDKLWRCSNCERILVTIDDK